MLLPGAAAEAIDHIFGILVFFRCLRLLWNCDEFAVFCIDGWSFGFGHNCLAHQHSFLSVPLPSYSSISPPKLVVHFDILQY